MYSQCVMYQVTTPEVRILAAIRRAVPTQDVRLIATKDAATDLTVGVTRLRATWVPRGWPREVRLAIAAHPDSDIVVAPSMSPGAREVARSEGVGWVDESSEADIAIGPLIVMRERTSTEPRTTPAKRWTPATAAVAEALLLDTKASVKEVVAATGLSTGSATNGLHFLASEGLVSANAARGRNSGRRVADPDALLSGYVGALAAFPRLAELRTGVLWSDPVADAVAMGKRWEAHERSWAATGALAAAVLAPFQTEISPIVIYVDAKSASDLHVAASEVPLREIDGGRLLLRAFPSPATARLSTRIAEGLRCAPWPRVFADLRNAGVRGEDAAEHLRERMLGYPTSAAE